MRTESVQNNGHRSVLIPLAQGAAIGAAAGMAGKYALPLTREEKNSDEYIKVSNLVNDQKKMYNYRTERYISKLNAKEKHSVAEDEFIKMFDGMKEGDRMKPSKIRTALNNLQNEKPTELLEFKRICKNSSEVAERTAKQFMNGYNLVTKHIRPTSFFVVAGAVLGAVMSLVNDILKVRVEH